MTAMQLSVFNSAYPEQGSGGVRDLIPADIGRKSASTLNWHQSVARRIWIRTAIHTVNEWPHTSQAWTTIPSAT